MMHFINRKFSISSHKIYRRLLNKEDVVFSVLIVKLKKAPQSLIVTVMITVQKRINIVYLCMLNIVSLRPIIFMPTMKLTVKKVSEVKNSIILKCTKILMRKISFSKIF